MTTVHHDEMKQDVISMYDRAAPLYGQVGTKQFTYFANLLIEKLALPTGAQVLDVATGRGALLFAAAEKVGSSGEVIGIDLAPGMIAATSNEIKQRGLTHARVQLMDGDQITFEPNTFDYVLCGFALHFLNYEQTLPTIRRILKPGGCFAALLPYVPVDNQTEFARWRWLFDLTKAVFPADFVPPAAWIAPRKLNKPELAQHALETAGFINVQIESHEAMLYFQDEDDWWAWEWSQGSRFWLEGMSPEGLDRFKRESFEHLRQMKTPDGIPMLDGARFAIGYKPH